MTRTDRDSFTNVKQWVAEIERYANEKVIKLLVGNKSDLPNRVVQTEEAEEFAKGMGCEFLETSARTANNVEQAFMTIAAQIKNNLSTELQSEGVKALKPLGKGTNVSGGKGGCC